MGRKLFETVRNSNNFSEAWGSIAFLVASMMLAGCKSNYGVEIAEFEQPPSEKISVHRVAPGETLYAIAWRYTMDVRQLAGRNGIHAPYSIYAGQRIALDLQGRDWSKKQTYGSSRSTVRSSGSGESAKGSSGSAISSLSRTRKHLWQWPTAGELLKQARHREARRQGYRGIDIAGKHGQPVVAATDGKVVYAGNGLKTLGNLLIIEHGNDYLSAYAHNSRLVVRRGDQVKAGQKIAELGSTGTYTDYLHFEIRHKGRPIDPLTLLPRTQGLMAGRR